MLGSETKEQLIKEFEAFLDQCIWLRKCYNIYKNLYESDEKTRKLLMDFAGWFFADINKIIIEYIPLQVCKITDPAKTSGKDNLTTAYINQQLKQAGIAGKTLEEIESYAFAMGVYREKIVQGRNKVISHSDKEIALSGEPVGVHEAEDVDIFFKNLFDYTDAVGNAIGVGPLDYRTIPAKGDVVDLIRNVREWDRSRQTE